MSQPTGLIAVMGATGSGKSSFVNSILGEERAPVGHGLESLTSTVDEYRYTTPKGIVVDLVDTPGFNDFRGDDNALSDFDILTLIAEFMKIKRDQNQKFAGIIYLHNISDPRIDSMQRRNLKLFREICGSESTKNVMVVTTFWDQLVSVSSGFELEDELKDSEEGGFFQQLHEGGAMFARSGRFEGGHPEEGEFLTPQEIVDRLLALDPVFLEMQLELGNGVPVAKTSAGSALLDEFKALKLELRQDITRMGEDIEKLKSASAEDKSERDRLKMESARLQSQLQTWDQEFQDKLTHWSLDVCTKDELMVHQQQLHSLAFQVGQLKDKSDDNDALQERNAELAYNLQKVEAERNDLSAKLQKSLDELRDLYFTLSTQIRHNDSERAHLKEQLYHSKMAAAESKMLLDAEKKHNMDLQMEVEKLRQELAKANEAHYDWRKNRPDPDNFRPGRFTSAINRAPSGVATTAAPPIPAPPPIMNPRPRNVAGAQPVINGLLGHKLVAPIRLGSPLHFDQVPTRVNTPAFTKMGKPHPASVIDGDALEKAPRTN